MYTFSEEEYRKGIAAPKNRKDASIDNLLKIKRNNNALENTAHSKYLSITQDRTLSYKETYSKQR